MIQFCIKLLLLNCLKTSVFDFRGDKMLYKLWQSVRDYVCTDLVSLKCLTLRVNQLIKIKSKTTWVAVKIKSLKLLNLTSNVITISIGNTHFHLPYIEHNFHAVPNTHTYVSPVRACAKRGGKVSAVAEQNAPQRQNRHDRPTANKSP